MTTFQLTNGECRTMTKAAFRIVGAENVVRDYVRLNSPAEMESIVRASKGVYLPVEIKIAALNLVSRGEADMTDNWSLQVAE